MIPNLKLNEQARAQINEFQNEQAPRTLKRLRTSKIHKIRLYHLFEIWYDYSHYLP